MKQTNYTIDSNNTNEIWKDIPGYEGLYQASTVGLIRSIDRIDSNGRFHKGHIFKPSINNWGYQLLCLSKNGVHKTEYVHQLIARTFIPNPLNLPEVNHRDEDKLNNLLYNLEWVTPYENKVYGTRLLKYTKKVLQFSLDGDFIQEWQSVSDITTQLNFSKTTLSKCLTGKIKSAYGYIWKYQSDYNNSNSYNNN